MDVLGEVLGRDWGLAAKARMLVEKVPLGALGSILRQRTPVDSRNNFP